MALGSTICIGVYVASVPQFRHDQRGGVLSDFDDFAYVIASRMIQREPVNLDQWPVADPVETEPARVTNRPVPGMRYCGVCGLWKAAALVEGLQCVDCLQDQARRWQESTRTG